MSVKKLILVALATTACSAKSFLRRQDQSSDPNLGTNSQAQGATEEVTAGAGPNGAESWFNAGIDDDSGWNPPMLNFSSLIHIDKDTFYSSAGSACSQYDQYFEASGSKYKIDPVILACIAMQESSCNADAGGSTPGLMQVSCDNYPNGQCTDSVADNVDAGTNYLRQELDSSNNNAIMAIASYNGWFTSDAGMNNGRGLTQDYPCSSEGRSNGDPQNLDYIQQMLNGWFLGLNPYGDESWIGIEKCSGDCSSGSKC